MSSILKNPWREVAPGRYERPLGNLERVLKSYMELFAPLKKEHWRVNVLARVSFDNISEDDKIAALRAAWIQTRYQFPLVAATLNGNNHVYQCPDQQELEQWLSESFFIHTDETPTDVLYTAELSTYSSVHFFPASSEVMMRTHHYQIDGIGSIHFLDQFLSLLATAGPSPKFGDEWTRLPPCHTEAAGLPYEMTPESDEAAEKLIDVHPLRVASVGLEMTPGMPQGTRRSILSLNPATLDALVASCKEKGLSVTSAINAAIVVATQDMAATDTASRDFTALAFFNHRGQLRAPYNDSSVWPMGVNILGLPFTLPRADFMTQVRALQSVYKQPISLGASKVDNYDAYIGKLAKGLSEPLPPNAPPLTASQPQLSSIGIVDGRVKHQYPGKVPVTLEYVEPVLEIMTTAILVFQWSFRGTLYINAAYNTAQYEAAYVDKFLAKVEEILLKGMGVATGRQ